MLGKAQPAYDRKLLEITLQLTDKTQVHNAYNLPAKSQKDLSH